MSTAPVYRRSGRGGAGNYFPQSQPITSATTVDLEAQTSSALLTSQTPSSIPTAAPSSSTTTTTTTSQLPSDSTIDVSIGTIVDRKYQTAGRGGAGNWYDTSITPSDGTNSGSNTDNTSSLSSSNNGADPHPYSKSNAEYKQTRTYGRGGTGNWEASEQMRLKKEKEEKEVEMKVMNSSSSSSGNGSGGDNSTIKDPVITLPDVAHVRVPFQEAEVERLDL